MKHLKQKLMAAASMVMVAFVMLTSASYAWFTISTTPEVQEINATATVNENFEIALGTNDGTGALDPDAKFAADKSAENTLVAYNTTGKNHYWGAMVTFNNTTTPLEGLGPAMLDETANQIKSTIYGADGRPAGLQELTEDTTAMTEGTITLYDADGNKVGQKILLWLRSNKEGDVTVDVSGVKFGDATGDKVELAFQIGDGDIVQVDLKDNNNTQDGAEVTNVKIGSISANVATKVYAYIYLEGENVSNEDVAQEVKVVIKNITFKNSGLTKDASTGKYTNAYTNDDSTPSNN